MREDTALRFGLSGKYIQMKYGDCVKIPECIALKAWPPTGEHDRSDEGFFRAMAIAAYGGRPETSYTTEERIINDLDDSFEVEKCWSEHEGNYFFLQRKSSECPKCHGRGWCERPQIEKYIPMRVGDFDKTTVIKKEMVKCNCHPWNHDNRRRIT